MMWSSIVTIAVFVLGLSATVYSADVCTTKCEVIKNGTAEWKNGVEIQYSADVTIYVSKAESVIVFINTKTKVVIAIDLKTSLVLVYKFDGKFGLVIDIKTGACVKVTLDINLVIKGDFTALRKALDKAQTDITAKGEAVIFINLQYTASYTFNIAAVFVSGSATIVAEIKATYTFFFQSCYSAGAVIGKGSTFVGVAVVAVFDSSSELVVGVASSINVVVVGGAQLSFEFGIFIAAGIQKGSADIFVKFQASFAAAIQAKVELSVIISTAIDGVRSGVSFERQITVGTFVFRFYIVLVREYLQLQLTLGQIKIDIGYTGTALAVYNSKANIVVVISRRYYFLYSYQWKAGYLISGNQLVYVTEATIISKIGAKSIITSGTLALFVSAHGEAVFKEGSKCTLKEFKSALESEDKFIAYAQANGIANASVGYKVCVGYAQSITVGFLGAYSFDVAIFLRVSFSLDASYTVDTSIYNNVIIIAVSLALRVVATSVIVISSATLYASLKIAVGGSS